MKSEFETLEQYQDSMKKFNENTRMGFEGFIQSHGSDRNKLQLRCTPYTSKKGGYGSFDLDFGLSLWQHQQSKVDELQTQLSLQRQRVKAFEEELTNSRNYGDELQKRVDFTLKVVQSMRNEVKHGHLSDDESQTLSGYANDLEQALKGVKRDKLFITISN